MKGMLNILLLKFIFLGFKYNSKFDTKHTILIFY